MFSEIKNFSKKIFSASFFIFSRTRGVIRLNFAPCEAYCQSQVNEKSIFVHTALTFNFCRGARR